MISTFKSAPLWFSLAAAGICFAAACSDDGDVAPICLDPKKCPAPEGNDEVGDGDGDREDDDYEFCTVQAGNGVRTVYQCDGHLKVSLEFSTLFTGTCAETLGSEEWCRESHRFGVDFDAYEMPAVMACCDEILTPEDTLLEYCAMDMIEQVCRSIPTRLEALINKGVIPAIAKPQAKHLLSWLKDNQQQCYDTFHRPDANAPGIIGPVTWKVNGGSNKKWSSLNNFTITVEEAVVTSAALPDDESQYLACKDSRLNNSEVFEGRGPISQVGDIELYALGASLDARILGPVLPGGARVVGAARSVSQSACTEPRCSSLELSEDREAGTLVLEDLSLFAEGPVSITYGELPVEIDDVALRLYGSGSGQLSASQDAYIIDPGGAHFLVTGWFGDILGSRWASNVTPMVLRASSDGWVIDSFAVTHTDSQGEAWTVTLPATLWN